MCGFIYNVTDYPLLLPLFEIAGYEPDEISEIIRHPHLRPTDKVLTMVPTRTGPKLMGSTWWLATHPDGSVNTSVTSFNSKSSKVGKSPLHTQKPRSVKSIVIGTGFCEWQPIFKGNLTYTDCISMGLDPKKMQPSRKIQHLIEPKEGGLMVFGAVSKLRLNPAGKPMVNTSIITLPPHEAFSDIHAKSFPLILKPSEIVDWIDPTRPFSNFDSLLTMESVREPFRISKVSSDFSEKVEVKTLTPSKQ